MRLLEYALLSLLFQGTTRAEEPMHFQRRGFNAERDLHLGTLRSLDDFYERVGTNASDWQAIEHEPPSKLKERAAWDTPGVTKSARTGSALMARQDDDICADKSGIEYYVCEALPSRAFIWTAGVAVIIYWTPSILDAFLDDVARLYGNGINLAARYQRIQNGAEGPVNKLKVRDIGMDGLELSHLALATRGDEFEPEYVHFNIENDMPQLAKRDLSADEEGVTTQGRSFTRFALRTATGELEPMGVDATLSADASERRRMRRDEGGNGTDTSNLVSNMKPGVGLKAVQAAEDWKGQDWSLVITGDRESSYFPESSTGCIKEYLKERLNEASEQGRASCMHMSEADLPSNYFIFSGVFINKGGNNFDLEFGGCCD